MKHLLITLLLLSAAAYSQEAAHVQEPDAAHVEEQTGHANWPSLDELWNETKTGNDLKSWLVDGTPSAEILLGYEYSDLKGNATDPAHAMLTRTRLNYLTGQLHGFDAFVQAQYVGPLNDHYSYPGRPNGYDPVSDPENFRFHQAYLAYTGYDSVGRLGSQEILLDNQRLIGNVGWRLNGQSFNAGSIQNESVENLKLYYAYADSINDILGDTIQGRQYHLLNGEYKLGEKNKLAAFAYLQRNDNSAANSKVDTYGARFWGASDALGYEAMGALQRSAYYGLLKGDLKLESVNLGLGAEYISGGGGDNNFQTLNGTAHKFNGWADQFLGTGGGLNSGLVDLWGEGSVMVAEKLKLQGVAHFFNTAYNTPTTAFSGVYGYELDFLAKYPVCENFDVLAKLAYYIQGDNDPGNFTNDETVFWLRGTMRF